MNLRGYGRLILSIGLHEEIANILKIVNFFGSKELENDFEAMKNDALSRAEDYHNEKEELGKHSTYSHGFGKQLVKLQLQEIMVIIETR